MGFKGHSSATGAISVWNISLSSVFCLTPPGDVPTRKGFFDSILAGCIPVTFDEYSAYKQWTWNLGYENAIETTLLITRSMREGQDIIQYLIDMYENHPEEILGRRKAIARVASQLQYRLPEELNGVIPPVDAVDVILDNIFRINRNMSELVRHPRDRGDHYKVDRFPDYP
jgi:hypothetical protein